MVRIVGAEAEGNVSVVAQGGQVDLAGTHLDSEGSGTGVPP